MIYNILICALDDSVLLFTFLSMLSCTKLIINTIDLIKGKEKNYDLLIVWSFLLIFATKHLVNNILKYDSKVCQRCRNKLEINNKINNKNIAIKPVKIKK